MTERGGRWYGYYGGITLIRTRGSDSYSLPGGELRPDAIGDVCGMLRFIVANAGDIAARAASVDRV